MDVSRYTRRKECREILMEDTQVETIEIIEFSYLGLVTGVLGV